MLSSTSEYALRVMVILARQKPGFFLKGNEIAKRANVPAAYLVKILQLLNRAGLVSAQKGIKGGYVLNGSPEQVSLFDIIEAVDPFTKMSKCPLGIAEHDMLCPLHRKIESAYGNFQNIFKNCRLKEFLHDEQPIVCTD